MDLVKKIRGFDFTMKKLCAIKHNNPSEMDRPLRMKREIKQSIHIPEEPASTFTMTVTDRVNFQPDEGPFSIEVVIGGTVYLDEVLDPDELKRSLQQKKNVNHLINQCLPHSCSIIAHLTEKMGYGPVILSPQYRGKRD